MELITDFETRYALEEETIGEGTYGFVSEVTEIATGDQYVVKTFKQHHGDNGIESEFIRELTIYKSLEQDKGTIGLFPRCKGYTIAPKMRIVIEKFDSSLMGKKFPNFDQLVNVYKSLLRGLDVLHKHNFLHRDIKPHNCLYNASENRAVLADLGSGRIMPDVSPNVKATTPVCTMWWRAPELLEADLRSGSRKYTPAMDIWALGCTFLELCGRMLPTSDTFSEEDTLTNLEMWFGKKEIKVDPEYEFIDPPTDVGPKYEALTELAKLIEKELTTLNISDLNRDVQQTIIKFRQDYINFDPSNVRSLTFGLGSLSLEAESARRDEAEKLLKSGYSLLNTLKYNNGMNSIMNATKIMLKARIRNRTGDPVRDYIYNSLVRTSYTAQQADQIVELLSAMLKWEPEDRISAREALTLPIFNNGRKTSLIPHVIRSFSQRKILTREEQKSFDLSIITRYTPYTHVSRNYRLHLDKVHTHRDVLKITNQPDINYRMYLILIEWLLDITKQFGLNPNTYHIGVKLLDDYLAKVRVTREELQLVGIVAQFIAAKYQEVYPPEAGDYVYISAGACSREGVMKTEIKFLNTVDLTLLSSPTVEELSNEVADEQKLTTAQHEVLIHLTHVITMLCKQHIVGKSDLDVILMVLPHLKVTDPKPTVEEFITSVFPYADTSLVRQVKIWTKHLKEFFRY